MEWRYWTEEHNNFLLSLLFFVRLTRSWKKGNNQVSNVSGALSVTLAMRSQLTVAVQSLSVSRLAVLKRVTQSADWPTRALRFDQSEPLSPPFSLSRFPLVAREGEGSRFLATRSPFPCAILWFELLSVEFFFRLLFLCFWFLLVGYCDVTRT